MRISAKYSSICPECGERIQGAAFVNGQQIPGETVEWRRGEKARHVRCALGEPVVPAGMPVSEARIIQATVISSRDLENETSSYRETEAVRLLTENNILTGYVESVPVPVAQPVQGIEKPNIFEQWAREDSSRNEVVDFNAIFETISPPPAVAESPAVVESLAVSAVSTVEDLPLPVSAPSSFPYAPKTLDLDAITAQAMRGEPISLFDLANALKKAGGSAATPKVPKAKKAKAPRTVDPLYADFGNGRLRQG